MVSTFLRHGGSVGSPRCREARDTVPPRQHRPCCLKRDITPPLDPSFGEQFRHRLSCGPETGGGMNHVLRIAAIRASAMVVPVVAYLPSSIAFHTRARPAPAREFRKRAAPRRRDRGDVPFGGCQPGRRSSGGSLRTPRHAVTHIRALLCPDHPSGPLPSASAWPRPPPDSTPPMKTATSPTRPGERLQRAYRTSVRASRLRGSPGRAQTRLSTILTVPPRQPLGPRSWAPSTRAPDAGKWARVTTDIGCVCSPRWSSGVYPSRDWVNVPYGRTDPCRTRG